MRAGQYSSGERGAEEERELTGLHVGCRGGKACAICQASEGGVPALVRPEISSGKTDGDADMFVEVLQALILAEADRDDVHGFLTDDDGTSISDDSHCS